MKCPGCGAENFDKSKWCFECGWPYDCPQCGDACSEYTFTDGWPNDDEQSQEVVK